MINKNISTFVKTKINKLYEEIISISFYFIKHL